MSMRVVFAVALFACVAGTSGAARAVTCYQIVDDGDRVLYRSTLPPFPLAGSEWSAAQTRLRAQRNYFMWFDSGSCPEDYPSRVYARSKGAADASAILSARDNEPSGGIFNTGAGEGAPATAGRAPVYVVPRGGRVALPVGGGRAYGR